MGSLASDAPASFASFDGSAGGTSTSARHTSIGGRGRRRDRSSPMGGGEVPPQCCTDPSPDGAGRKPALCMRFAGAGACDGSKNADAKRQCPAACGACTVCRGHPMYETYAPGGELYQVRQAAAEKLARRSQRLHLKGVTPPGGGGGKGGGGGGRGGGGGDGGGGLLAASDHPDATDAPPFAVPRPMCGRLNSSVVPPSHAVQPFASVRDATRVSGLVGSGVVATSCVGRGACTCAPAGQTDFASQLLRPLHAPAPASASFIPANRWLLAVHGARSPFAHLCPSLPLSSLLSDASPTCRLGLPRHALHRQPLPARRRLGLF